MHHSIRVLFLCTGNSARSQMAEGLLRHFGGDDFAVYSAGTEPAGLHPLAMQVMDQIGIDISDQQSQHLDTFVDQTFDFAITVCDRARDRCPTFPGDTECIHWSFDDSAAVEGDKAIRLRAFNRCATRSKNDCGPGSPCNSAA